ncbi:hypothetical protein AAES_117633 [Amazona aestiva]|uniref:Peptidase S1 domain-containing protein n=1 Tax=Amazona aestiva TaxID=12930 RepID=A0A0Q3PB41_AMAAE|nr:hypothetical protein AAES_117633 [Amazona aestiva]
MEMARRGFLPACQVSKELTLSGVYRFMLTVSTKPGQHARRGVRIMVLVREGRDIYPGRQTKVKSNSDGVAERETGHGHRGHHDLLDVSTVCGKPVHPITEVQRILGGKAARRGSFPWQALTGIHGRGGGALLGDRWILTAAHTIFPKGAIGKNASLDELAEKANIFLGHTSVEELRKMGNHPVRRIFIHPDYKPKDDHNFDGDIALLELKHPVTLGPAVLPICLPDATNTTFYMDGHMGYVSGFGVEKYFISNHLKYVSLPAVSREKCQSWLDSKKSDDVPMVFSENMFCAGFLTVKQDTCQGDSGSVLTALDTQSGRWVATGIVSWGIGCAEGYGFYTKIINYLDWIKGIIKEDKL